MAECKQIGIQNAENSASGLSTGTGQSAAGSSNPMAGSQTATPSLEQEAIKKELDQQYQRDLQNIVSLKEQDKLIVEKNALSVSDRTIATGKTKIYIDRNSRGPSEEDSVTSTLSNEQDFLRIKCGKYWAMDNFNQSLIYLNGLKNSLFLIKDYNLTGKGIINVDTITAKTGIISSTTRNVVDYITNIVKNPSDQSGIFASQQALYIVTTDASNISKVQINKDFYDFSFEMPVPFLKKELKRMQTANTPLYANVEPIYNFYIKSYEEIIKGIKEQLLPNIYSIVSEFDKGVGNVDSLNHISLANTLMLKDFSFKILNADILKEGKNRNYRKATGEYFDSYARAFDYLNTQQETNTKEKIRLERIIRLEQLTRKFSVIGIPVESMSLLKDSEDKKYVFPMYNEIEFSTDFTTELVQCLKDSYLSSTLMKRLMRADVEQSQMEARPYFEAAENLSYKKLDDGTKTLIKSYKFEDNIRRSWNIMAWLKLFYDLDSANTTNKNNAQVLLDDSGIDIGLFLGDIGTDANMTNPGYKFVKTLMKIIFLGKVRTLLKTKFRTYEELMAGKLAYSETVMYKVIKYLGDTLTGEKIGTPIQAFYLPNSNEIEVMKFVDSQVKYGQCYVYEVYAYQAVFGTRYNYNNLTRAGSNSNSYAFSTVVTQYPELRLVEVPYFTIPATIVDAPPVFPQVDIIPYKGIGDRLLLAMNFNTGEYKTDPIIIEEEDKVQAKFFRKAQNLEEDEEITYRTDDLSQDFQIYRTEKYPESYRDFKGQIRAIIGTDVNMADGTRASSATFMDQIKINTKYWYMFRVIDVHGHISNPSEVFEVEMVYDSGCLYPIVNIIEMKEIIPMEPTKSARKYIMIAPALQQTIINEKQSGMDKIKSATELQNVVLGIADQTVWGKKFKIRIISNKTGKKIDINVNFTNKFIKNENS